MRLVVCEWLARVTEARLFQCGISEGGLIPKTLYMPVEELEKQTLELCGGMESVYHMVSLARGQVSAAAPNDAALNGPGNGRHCCGRIVCCVGKYN